MHTLTVLVNDQGDVAGTAITQTQGQGTGLPGRVSLVARPGQHVIEIEVGDEILNLDPPALHEFIKASYLRPGAGQVTSQRGSTPESDRPDRPAGKVSSPRKEPNLVIAPGGPRPRESVHAVGPNEIVRRNPDETYTVVPNNSAKRAAAKKAVAKKAPAKKTPAKKTPAKKAAAKAAPAAARIKKQDPPDLGNNRGRGKRDS